MRVSENPLSRPNDTIFIEDTIITHIEDQCLPIPCSARVTLSLYPTIMCRIDSDNLPVWLVNYQYSPFTITVENGCKIKAMLSYNLSELLYNRDSNDTFKGFLVPCKHPCTVIQANIRIRSVSFSVLNFQGFSGHKDKWIAMNGNFHRLGVAEMKHGGWQIKITEDPTFSENEKLLRNL